MFGGMYAHGRVGAQVGDTAWLHALLDAEAALARACARAGVIDAAHAEAIGACCVPERFDASEIGRAAAASGNPVVPLVRELTRAVGGDAARHVHYGATSQDIMDTAAVLVSRRASAVIQDDAAAVADGLAALADAHRSTLMPGRTLLQQALPTTFGLVAAGWLQAVGTASQRLGTPSPAQLGGAAGTLASLGEAGPRVAAAFADELGLAEPVLPWHTDRGPIAELTGALARMCGAVGKVAGDIVLLAQTEVGEVIEAGGAGVGGSSALPHKRNPVAAVSARACAGQAPGLAAALYAAQAQEYQRAAGAWQSEWLPMTQLLRVTGSAVAWLRTSVERLRVDPKRMRGNLDLTGGLPLAERVTTDLTPDLGRLPAHDLVKAACAEAVESGRDLADVLTERLDGRRTAAQVAALLDPAGYLGAADTFIDRAIAAHRSRAAKEDDKAEEKEHG
ncbi:3-carboxy-cis,cis-muconate cycloisomerase [Nocardiopsis gilva YIM 90087]|uniref:3-carboxy-cis,cis-muconate cycloisomerase n=2 Tax=Nocardiopsis gilva TaxID=280236 RepID=A0A223SDX2_9ACTN|nr:3-carboxy-cis,cis-muconate cycloisomerase [Nocardiopsis gilva YIM 90087]